MLKCGEGPAKPASLGGTRSAWPGLLVRIIRPCPGLRHKQHDYRSHACTCSDAFPLLPPLSACHPARRGEDEGLVPNHAPAPDVCSRTLEPWLGAAGWPVWSAWLACALASRDLGFKCRSPSWHSSCPPRQMPSHRFIVWGALHETPSSTVHCAATHVAPKPWLALLVLAILPLFPRMPAGSVQFTWHLRPDFVSSAAHGTRSTARCSKRQVVMRHYEYQAITVPSHRPVASWKRRQLTTSGQEFGMPEVWSRTGSQWQVKT